MATPGVSPCPEATQNGEVIPVKKLELALLTEAPEWFLAIAALVYATGFLVVFTFFARLGIREAGTEFFKVKYIHVGILCLIIPVLTAIPIYALWYIHAAEDKEKKAGKSTSIHLYLPNAILTLNLIATFYVYVMFAPPGYLRTRGHAVPLVFAVTLLGLAGIGQLTGQSFQFLVNKGAGNVSTFSITSEGLRRTLRWILCLGVVVFLDRYAFKGMGSELGEMMSGAGKFTNGGYIFLCFVGLMVWLVWRLKLRVQTVENGRIRIAIWAAGGAILVAAFYLCILSFAYSVYPYVPAERGGGSYVDASTVVFVFQPGATALPSDCLDSGGKSKPLIVIEETGTSIYVAHPSDAGGPTEWRRGALPRVFGIRREVINSIQYTR